MCKSKSSCFLIFGIIFIGVVSLAAHAGVDSSAATQIPNAVSQMLRDAGNVNSDVERFQIMQQIQQRDDLPEGFREDLDRLTLLIQDWAYGNRVSKNKPDQYLTYVLRFKIVKATAPKNKPATLLNPLHQMYLARTLYMGMMQEFGKYLHKPDKRDKWLTNIYRKAQLAHNAFPKNNGMAILAGKRQTPWPKQYQHDPNAPEWANLQRVALEGNTDIVHWWIDTRQREGGYFGTGWGDDIEMWRRGWSSVLIAFDDPKASAAWEKLVNGVFELPHMNGGYSSIMTDVEHSAEDSADTLTPMMVLQRDNPRWMQLAKRPVELARSSWMGTNERGQLQHKTIHFAGGRLNREPRYAADATYFCRVYQPAMLSWQRTKDPELTEFFSQWANTWVDASMRAERGKPAGILPSAIRWPDGVVGGQEDPWHIPNLWGVGALYRWPQPNANNMMCNLMLLTWLQTGDEKYLQPLHAMARMWRDDLAGKYPDRETMGTVGWAAANVKRFLMPSLIKYRLISGDTQYDDLLLADAQGYISYRIDGDETKLIADLKEHAEAMTHNFELYTSECRGGDRMLVSATRYFAYSKHVDPIAIPRPEVVYAMATGDPDPRLYCTIAAARWLTPPREIAAFVKQTDSKSMAAELYHFGKSQREMGVQLCMLDKGKYRWTLTRATQPDQTVTSGTFDLSEQVIDIRFTLPSRDLCVLTIERAGDLRKRID